MARPTPGREFARASNASYEAYRQRLKRADLQPGEPYPAPGNPSQAPAPEDPPTDSA